MSCQKYISIEAEQNSVSLSFFELVENIASLLIQKEDMLSNYYADKILNCNKTFKRAMTAYLSPANARRMIQMCFCLGVIAVQWVIPLTNSWTFYFLFSRSGLSLVMYYILQSPVLGSLFFLSFYQRLLGVRDIDTFNRIASFYGLPEYSYGNSLIFSSSVVRRLISNVENKFMTKVSDPSMIGQYIKTGLSVGMVKGEEAFGALALRVISKSPPELLKKEAVAVYHSKRDYLCFDSSEIDSYLEWVTSNKSELKKYAKSYSKTKKEYKKNLKALKSPKTKDGKSICLDACVTRAKTNMGCYCDGPCGKSSVLSSSKDWCRVDASKCKRGKGLPMYMGRPYDFCNKKRNSLVCFNGNKYVGCKVED